MAGKSTFEITKKAGNFVAGVRNLGAGKKLTLTAEQAKYPLITGEIIRAGTVPAAEPVGGKSKKA